jgi:hypothetical protein
MPKGNADTDTSLIHAKDFDTVSAFQNSRYAPHTHFAGAASIIKWLYAVSRCMPNSAVKRHTEDVSRFAGSHQHV